MLKLFKKSKNIRIFTYQFTVQCHRHDVKSPSHTRGRPWLIVQGEYSNLFINQPLFQV